MWLYLMIGVLVATEIDAKKRATPPVEEVEVKAGRTSASMECGKGRERLSDFTWKIGYQQIKADVLDEKWEDLPAERFVLSEEDSTLTVRNTEFVDRSNIKCEYNATSEANVTEIVSEYFRLRVRDPNGAAWPTVGIAVEAVVLFIVITAFEYVARNKSGSK